MIENSEILFFSFDFVKNYHKMEIGCPELMDEFENNLREMYKKECCIIAMDVPGERAKSEFGDWVLYEHRKTIFKAYCQIEASDLPAFAQELREIFPAAYDYLYRHEPEFKYMVKRYRDGEYQTLKKAA